MIPNEQNALLANNNHVDEYRVITPFVSGITRSTNVRVYSPLCRINPYSKK